jgi:hypothetical protein
MMEARRKLRGDEPIADRWLDVEEVRLIADLRIMHSKVDELFQLVTPLKQHHPEADIRKYADQIALESDIHEVDQIYLWFIGLRDA